MRNAEGGEPESGVPSPIRNPKSEIRNPPVPPLVLFEFFRNARRVSACSSAAWALGVRRGMPVAEAAALADENRLLLQEHDRAADLRYLRRLAEWCEQFSPLVGWQATDTWRPADSPDSLLLDVTGLERLFGGEGTLARGVTRAFRRRGFPVRVAVADTIGGAWAMAHYGPWRKGRWAPLIVDNRAEGNAAVSPAGDATDWHSAFEHLPLAALRIPNETIDLLAALGLSTVAEVAALPRKQLSARFGGGLLTRLDQLQGAAEERIAAHRAPPAFVAEAVLNHPTHRPETIEAIIEQLLAQACRQLARRRRGALQLEVRLYAMRHVLARLSVGLYRASAAVSHLLDLMRLQLEQVHLPDLVTDVALEVTATGKLELRQRSLFSHGEETRLARADDGRRLAELVDRLSSRLGALAVVQPRLLRDAQPEFACRWLALTGDAAERIGAGKQPPTRPKKTAGSARKADSADAAWARRDIPPRPLWLLSRPEPLAVTLAAAAVGTAAPPLAFRYQGRRHQVTASWGPERIETGWWRGGMVRRDYYRVETTAGLRFWLFRRSDGAWFLHGEFD